MYVNAALNRKANKPKNKIPRNITFGQSALAMGFHMNPTKRKGVRQSVPIPKRRTAIVAGSVSKITNRVATIAEPALSEEKAAKILANSILFIQASILDQDL